MNTINVNGKVLPTAIVRLTFAKSALRILSAGMKMRNVNVKVIKNALAEDGVMLSGRTAEQCLEEVITIIDFIKSEQGLK